MNRAVSWGVTVHIVLLISVFDIYFKSPILEGVEPVENDLPAPAKRLVLFSGDGIRADSLFKMTNGTSPAPFLRSIIETVGMWGISNARLPTESRPGHVAIIAGMYEDPSAIFKGWQSYSVDFDSIFNRSYSSFCWGSPDILTIFSKDSKKKDFYNFAYAADLQHFSGVNESAASLTYWVVDQFKEFMNEKKNLELINHDKTIFFFHFLGTDIAGHTSKPKSDEYIANILAVDQSVKKIHDYINSYFQDESTAFIFTSDHGMTDWGSHGDGTPSETMTPIVTWGAGLSSPKLKVPSGHSLDNELSTPPEWELSLYHRFDINQADITPLMAVLIGISIPVNSVGVLPINFLDMELKWILDAVILNAKQLKSQFMTSQEIIKSKLFKCFFKLFPEPDLDNLSSLAGSINNLTVSEHISHAIRACNEYIEGIDFYVNYFSTFSLTILSLLFIGWMLNLCIEIISRTKLSGVVMSYSFHLDDTKFFDNISLITATLLATVSSLLLLWQEFHISYYVYCFLAIKMWLNVAQYSNFFSKSYEVLSIDYWNLIRYFLAFFMILELLVLAFKWRGFLSLAVILMNVFWVVEEGEVNRPNNEVFGYFFLSNVIVACFPLLPTVGAFTSLSLVIVSGYLWIALRLLSIRNNFVPFATPDLAVISTILVATLNNLVISLSYDFKVGLPLLCQFLSWSLLCTSFVLFTWGPRYSFQQYFVFIAHCLSVPYILMSTGHEAAFLCFLTWHLFVWISLERYGFNEIIKESYLYVTLGPRRLGFSDFRIASFFLIYILLGFFGVGNIASLNSYDPAWVRGFITLFSPFTMMALIMFKTLTPIFLVSCALRIVIPIHKKSVEVMFSIVLLFCDVLCLNFFLSITNKGSWLEIGTSLSQFILMDVVVIFLLLMHAIAQKLMPLPSRR